MKASQDSFDRLIHRQIGPVLIGRRRIARRIGQLGRQITDCYRGKELTVVAVVKGSMIFLSDLLRRMPLVVRLEIAGVCSYEGRAVRSRGPKVFLPITADLAGREVLLVDDILDSGLTMDRLIQQAAAMNPASLRTCVLVRKDRPDVPRRPEVDFVGFDIADRFVVGCGLDFNHLYRNLPDLRALEESVASCGSRVAGKENPGKEGKQRGAAGSVPRRTVKAQIAPNERKNPKAGKARKGRKGAGG